MSVHRINFGGHETPKRVSCRPSFVCLEKTVSLVV